QRFVFAEAEQEIGERFTRRYPEIVKLLAAKSYDHGESEAIANLAKVWMDTGSLTTAAEAHIESALRNESWSREKLASDMLGQLLRTVSDQDKTVVLRSLAAKVLAESTDNATKIVNASANILSSAPELVREHFLNTLESGLADSRRDYQWRLSVART